MSTHARIHTWNGTDVVPYETGKTREMLCVDHGRADAEGRYGYFDKDGHWHHVPFEDFPPAFVMALMLLGIQE